MMASSGKDSVVFVDERADEPGVSFHSNPQDRAVLKMMTNVRSAMSSGTNLFTSGKLQVCATLFKNAIKMGIRDRKLTRMPENLVEVLETGLRDSANCKDKRDEIWHLRHALDVVYDEYVDMYCGIKDAKFHPVHKTISNVISLAVSIESKKCEEYLVELFRKTSQEILKIETISEESKSMLKKALDVGDDGKPQMQVSVLRKALDYVYDEVRLPDMHHKLLASISEQKPSNKEEFLLDYSGKSRESIKFNPKILCDTCMGGKSTAQFLLSKEEAVFSGNISTERDGGFASVRFHPPDVMKFRDVLKACSGFVIVAKNLEDKVQRFKLQLASEQKKRAFNYQSELVLPPLSEYIPMFLHISTFWPTIFGHVLADQGKICMDAVDTLGIIVSKLSDDGKPNPDFNEGRFSIAIQELRIIF